MRALPRARRLVLLIAMLAALGGCGGGLAPVDRHGYGPAPDGYYRIRPGDTLSEIAERRRISMRRLAAWNDLGPPYRLYAGALLRVEPPDGGAAPAPARAVRTSARPSPKTAGPRKPGSAAAASGIDWAWPVRGPVVQGFSAGDRTRQGIRIAADSGTPVAAAADGTVVYSGGGLEGYGNLIIVKHDQRYLSAYGYNRRLLVTEGAKVRQGQNLAEVGASAAGKPMLHFEVRRDGAALDPLLFLPKSR